MSETQCKDGPLVIDRNSVFFFMYYVFHVLDIYPFHSKKMNYEPNQSCYYSSSRDHVVLNVFDQEPQQVKPQGVKKREGDYDYMLTKPFYGLMIFTLVLLITMEFADLKAKSYILILIYVGWTIIVSLNIKLSLWFVFLHLFFVLRINVWLAYEKKFTEKNTRILFNSFRMNGHIDLMLLSGIIFIISILILLFVSTCVTAKLQAKEKRFFDEVLKHPGPYEKMRRNVSIIIASKIINIDHRDQSKEEIVKDMAIIMSGFHCKHLFDIDYNFHRIHHREGDDAVKIVNLEEGDQTNQYPNQNVNRDTNFVFSQPNFI